MTMAEGVCGHRAIYANIKQGQNCFIPLVRGDHVPITCPMIAEPFSTVGSRHSNKRPAPHEFGGNQTDAATRGGKHPEGGRRGFKCERPDWSMDIAGPRKRSTRGAQAVKVAAAACATAKRWIDLLRLQSVKALVRWAGQPIRHAKIRRQRATRKSAQRFPKCERPDALRAPFVGARARARARARALLVGLYHGRAGVGAAAGARAPTPLPEHEAHESLASIVRVRGA